MDNFQNVLTTHPDMKTKETALASIKNDVGAYGDVSMGTDVEVLWLQKHDLLDGTRNFNFFRADHLFTKSGLYGTDGRTVQGEWRVTPAEDVRILMRNVHEMITLCKTFIAVKQQLDQNLMSIFPYGMGIYNIIEEKKLDITESIGLHIHFGSRFNNGNRIPLTVGALDGLLAPVIKLFEPKLGAHMRTNCGFYGDLSDYKPKPYGFEYRTLPSCIDNKEIFTGAFALAKAIVFETRFGQNITDEDLKYFIIPKAKQNDKNFLRIMAKKSKMFIKRRCRFYHVYKKEIDTLFDLASKKDAEKLYSTHEDIFSSWGIECDLKNKVLVEAFQKDRLLKPCGVVRGYLGEEGKTIASSLHKKEIKTFSLGDQLW